jgi:hypothetical protein
MVPDLPVWQSRLLEETLAIDCAILILGAISRRRQPLPQRTMERALLPWYERALTESPQIFTLEIDGRPTLVFEATGITQASEICLDADLRSDLCALTSDGISICTEGATLSPRPARQEEIVAFRHAVEVAPASDEPTMAFLIRIDGVTIVTIGPEWVQAKQGAIWHSGGRNEFSQEKRRSPVEGPSHSSGRWDLDLRLQAERPDAPANPWRVPWPRRSTYAGQRPKGTAQRREGSSRPAGPWAGRAGPKNAGLGRAACFPTVGNLVRLNLASTSVFWSMQAVTCFGLTGASKTWIRTAELMNWCAEALVGGVRPYLGHVAARCFAASNGPPATGVYLLAALHKFLLPLAKFWAHAIEKTTIIWSHV